jgi:hypothetical protein
MVATARSDRNRADGLTIALLVACLQLWLLARHGIITPPDTGSFIEAADALAAPGGFLDASPLAAVAIPRSFYRPPLYPVLIIAARVLAGEAWAELIVGLQVLVAGIATMAFNRALLALVAVRWLAALGTVAQATTFALATHPALLADSLYASLLCLALAILLRRGMAQGLGPRDGLLVGALLGTGTLLREVGAYTGLLWLPLVLAAAQPRGRRGALVAVGATLLPMAGVVGGMLAWNLARSGQPFLTTVGQIVYFQALLPLARRGLDVFATDPVLADAAAQAIRRVELEEIDLLNTLLWRAHGLDAIAIARLAGRAWGAAWRRYPLAMAAATLGRIKAHHALTLFLPLENAAHVGLWATGVPPLLARFDRLARAAVTNREPDLLAMAMAALACRAVAVWLLARYLLVPWLARRRLHDEPAARLALAAWPVWPATLGLHALVHLEIRYFAPTLPLAIAAAVWSAARRRGRA